MMQWMMRLEAMTDQGVSSVVILCRRAKLCALCAVQP
jgi:hypothetical protein